MKSRIVIDPAICHGKPTIQKTRVLISNILSSLAAGESAKSLLANYPNLTKKDISAALEFGSQLANFESLPYKKSS